MGAGFPANKAAFAGQARSHASTAPQATQPPSAFASRPPARVRTKIRNARRLVVKVGSALVTNNGAGLDKDALDAWARQIAALRAEASRGKQPSPAPSPPASSAWAGPGARTR